MAQEQTKINAKSAQEFVSVKEIRDGVVILKDGSLRAILMASSLNFALKSAEEQEAVIIQYQNFLNSLDFSVQFFIQSQKLNIAPYLDSLAEKEKEQTNELLKIQTREYIEFVKSFVEAANIVAKTFYVVVPYTPPILELGKGGFLSNLFGAAGKKSPTRDQRLDAMKIQLWQRIDAVNQGLVRFGVRAAPLNTEELVELFYGIFNPGELEKGKPPAMG